MSREEPAKEPLKDLTGMIQVEDLEKEILKGEICMRQFAIDAARDAKFLSSHPATSPFTAAIVSEGMSILNLVKNPIHLHESWSK